MVRATGIEQVPLGSKPRMRPLHHALIFRVAGNVWCRAGGLEPHSDAYKATASPSKLARQSASSWWLWNRNPSRHYARAFRDRLMVGHGNLAPVIWVRLLVPEPTCAVRTIAPRLRRRRCRLGRAGRAGEGGRFCRLTKLGLLQDLRQPAQVILSLNRIERRRFRPLGAVRHYGAMSTAGQAE